MAFKIKTKNRNPINTRQTLDATHHEIIDQLQQDVKQIPTLKLQIEAINKNIDAINCIINQNITDPLFCIKQQDLIWKLDDEKIELEQKIKTLETSDEEKRYLLKTGGIIQKYYKLIEQEGTDDNTPICNIINTTITSSSSNSFKTNKNIDKRCVLDWFQGNHQNNYNEKQDELSTDDEEDDEIIINETENIEQSNQISSIFNENENITTITNDLETKGKLYNKYMAVIQPNFIIQLNEDENLDICSICNIEMFLNQNTGTLICQQCGIQEYILIDSDKPSYKDPPKEMTSFCYKRINHLNEFLAQFQAKETTEIDEDIYNEILVEIKKERINNMAELTPEKLRVILRKIKRNDYYEHIPYIINQLNGLPPPVISPEVEEIIRNMFKEIQIPFDIYCPPKRKNFLSYNFVMYKFFELLELDEYLNSFQLLKSRMKLHQQDQIWKKICNSLNWEFIPSL